MDRLHTEYMVFRKDERTGFDWNSPIDLKKEQREIMDVVIKNTQ